MSGQKRPEGDFGGPLEGKMGAWSRPQGSSVGQDGPIMAQNDPEVMQRVYLIELTSPSDAKKSRQAYPKCCHTFRFALLSRFFFRSALALFVSLSDAESIESITSMFTLLSISVSYTHLTLPTILRV